VKKKNGEDRPVALPGERGFRRRGEELPRLAIADRRRLALVGALFRSLHASWQVLLWSFHPSPRKHADAPHAFYLMSAYTCLAHRSSP